MDKIKLNSVLIDPGTTIKGAMETLNETAEKILLVIGGNEKLLGTITDGDIRRGIISGLQFNDKVESVMQKECLTISFGCHESKEKIKDLMIKHRLEHIPVVDKSGKVVDIITWTSLFGECDDKIPKQFKPNQVVIMAGGKGARLDPFTKILPKPLLPIGGKPIIELQMERFYKEGFNKFIYTLNYKKEYLKLFLKEKSSSYDISWVEEDDFLGTIGSLSLLKDKVKDTFFVTNCDSLLDVNFEEVLKWHKEHNASLTVIGSHSEFNIPFGILEISDGRLQKILEKPTHDFIINTGVYVMEPHVISYLDEGKQMDMDKLIDHLLKREKVTVYPIYKGWLDLGQWEKYNKTMQATFKFDCNDGT